MTQHAKELGFFCDFDGTITTKDRITTIMREFVPEQAEQLIARVNRRELSVRAGVQAMFALIPSARFEEVREFVVSTTVIRRGFDRFVDYAAQHDWPVTVISGGFDFFVEPALAPWRDRLQVYCNRIDVTGEHLRTVWPYPCDHLCSADCGLCKPTILREHAQSVLHPVFVGDGVSDFQGARHVDFVYARASLLEECRRHGLAHHAYETFDDIIAHLESGSLDFSARHVHPESSSEGGTAT